MRRYQTEFELLWLHCLCKYIQIWLKKRGKGRKEGWGCQKTRAVKMRAAFSCEDEVDEDNWKWWEEITFDILDPKRLDQQKRKEW